MSRQSIGEALESRWSPGLRVVGTQGMNPAQAPAARRRIPANCSHFARHTKGVLAGLNKIALVCCRGNRRARLTGLRSSGDEVCAT